MARVWKSGHASPENVALDAWLRANETGKAVAAKTTNELQRRNRKRRKSRERVARWKQRHRALYNRQQRQQYRKRRQTLLAA